MFSIKIISSLIFYCFVLNHSVSATNNNDSINYSYVRAGSPFSLECQKRNDSSIESFELKRIDDPNKEWRVTKKITADKTPVKLDFIKVDHTHNGTYECVALNSKNLVVHRSKIYLIVEDIPKIKIELIVATGMDSVYLNWTVNDHNSRVTKYEIEYLEYLDDVNEWKNVSEKINTSNSSFVVKNLKHETTYKFRIRAQNSIGISDFEYSTLIKTYGEDPTRIPPSFSVVEHQNNHSITMKIEKPSEEKFKDFRFSYKIKYGNDTKVVDYLDSNTRHITIDNLKTNTTYRIQISACSHYAKYCGAWSPERNINLTSGSPGVKNLGIYFLILNIVLLYIYQ